MKNLSSHIIGHVFQLAYAVYCDKLIQGEKISPCHGYTIQNPSQRQHPCLIMDIEYTWFYYHEAVSKLILLWCLRLWKAFAALWG